MTLETAQILCSARHKILAKRIEDCKEFDKHLNECEHCSVNPDYADWNLESEINEILEMISKIPYKSTHLNHPSVVWASESSFNFLWLCNLGFELANQYTLRYGKSHKSLAVIEDSMKSLSDMILFFDSMDPTMFALAMPEELQGFDPVQSYRSYYKLHKADIAKWEKGVSTPKWFKQ
jgi:hypothetical protein